MATESRSAPSMSARDWALLLALSGLWGGSFFFAKIAVAEVPPLTLALGRVAIAAATLGLVLAALGRKLPRGRAVWAAFLGMGLINNAVPFSLFFWAQRDLSAGTTAILNATTPFFAVLAAHRLTTDEKATAGKVTGVAIGFFGVVVMIGPGGLAGLGQAVPAQLACLAAAASYALAGLFGRRFERMGVKAIDTAFGQLAAASLIMAVAAAAVEQPWTLPAPSGRAMAAMIGLATVSTALGYVLYFRLLASAGATNLLLVTMLIPASALLLGGLFLGERLEAGQIAGMALIGLGLSCIDGRVWRGWRDP